MIVPGKYRRCLLVALLSVVNLLPSCSSRFTLFKKSQAGKQDSKQIIQGNAPSVEKNLFSVATRPLSFNPSLKDSSVLSYILKQDARVSVTITDEDGFPIRHLIVDQERRRSDQIMEPWNGKDDFGAVVPDEAYYPIITVCTPSGCDTINPLLSSGGIEFDAANVKIDNKTISYTIEQPSRMLVRCGIKKGALLNTPVSWKPRVAGAITDYWNGKDVDTIQDLTTLSSPSNFAIYGYTLPQPCWITFGNKSIDYRTYRESKDSSWQKIYKTKEEIRDGKKISADFLQPGINRQTPLIHVTIPPEVPRDKNGTPQLSGKALVKIEIDARDFHFMDEQYEITFFIDNEYYAEQELGYVPFNWLWNLSDVKPGEHILTVNVSSYRNRIGVRSMRVKVGK
jgi:hypothetical protein